MKSNTWLKLWRSQFNNELLDGKPYNEGYAWLWLCSRASHKPGTVNFRNEYIDIKRGELITSKLKMAQKFGWTYRRVENFIKALKSESMITSETTNRYIKIFILNYAKYQGADEQSAEQNAKQSEEQQHEQMPNRDTHTRRKRIIKKEKNINSSEQSSPVNTLFDVFQKVNPTINYGNMTSRKAAEWMISKWGIEATLRIAEYACSIHGEAYSPTITTPYQLKEKISVLKAFKEKQQNNKTNFTVI